MCIFFFMPESRLQSTERLKGGFLISKTLSSRVRAPAGLGSRQARAGWPDEVMMAGLLWGSASEAPCTDTSRSAVWIPLSDSLHRRSCHHCNQESDMPSLVMDGLRPLHRRHRKLTHVHPGMKTWHLQALRERGVSSPGSGTVSRKWRTDCPRFLAPFSKPPDRRDLTSSALKLHISTRAGSQRCRLSGCRWRSTAKQTWTI